MKAGEDFNLKPFGIRAMDSLRIEKSYKLIGTEMSIEYAAMESGLDRFVHLNKGNFIGRDALVAWQQKGFQNQFVTLEVKALKMLTCLEITQFIRMMRLLDVRQEVTMVLECKNLSHLQ